MTIKSRKSNPSHITTITHKEIRANDIELSASKRAETILINKYNIDLEGNHVR